MFKDLRQNFGIGGAILVIFGLFILCAFLSLALFTLGYWLITLILFTFFGFILPFSLWYSLGAWLISLIIGLFVAPARIVKTKIHMD